MIKMSIKEYNSLPVLYNDDIDGEFDKSIFSLKIGDLYLIKPHEFVEKGDVLTVYQIINKKSNSIESVPRVVIINE